MTFKIFTKWFDIEIFPYGWYLSIRTKWGWYRILQEDTGKIIYLVGYRI